MRAVDLTGKRFGRLKAISAVEERSRDGRVQWLCECHPPFGGCGNTVTVPGHSLSGGNTHSCGCIHSEQLRRRNVKKAGRSRRKEAWKAREVVSDGGFEWYSFRRARLYLKVDGVTLLLWSGLNKKGPKGKCPWLGGKRIQTRPFEGAFGRLVTYFRKMDLDHTLSAKASCPPAAPDYPGLTYVGDAAAKIGVSTQRVYGLLKERGQEGQLTRKDGFRDNGWACQRSYVPTTFVTEMTAARAAPEAPGNSHQPAQALPAPPAAANTAAQKQTRVKRARAKHLKWREWKDGGLSYAAVAIKHEDETGETVTEDAVKKALKRLPRPS
jgi:hypothetical protein